MPYVPKPVTVLALAAASASCLACVCGGGSSVQRYEVVDTANVPAAWEPFDFGAPVARLSSDGDCAVGPAGAVFLRDDDGWTAAPLGDETADLVGCASWGYAGRIVVAMDGRTWLLRDGGSTRGQTLEPGVTAVASYRTRSVVVGDHVLWDTSDGETFTRYDAPVVLRDVFVDGYGWAVGDGGAMFRLFGDLEPVDVGATGTLRAIGASGWRKLVAGDDGAWFSPDDGVTWTAVTAPTGIRAIASDDDRNFYVLTETGLWTSADGAAWTQVLRDVDGEGVDVASAGDGVVEIRADGRGWMYVPAHVERDTSFETGLFTYGCR